MVAPAKEYAEEAQGRQAAAAGALWNVPAAQGAQSDRLARATALLNVPGGHDRSSLDPGGQ